jgi:hypothetical protein
VKRRGSPHVTRLAGNQYPILAVVVLDAAMVEHPQDQRQLPRPERVQDQRRDLQAAVEARRELGPEYEPQLIESFLERLDRDIDQRLDARVSGHRPRPDRTNTSIPIALGSLGLGIPLSGIAGGTGGLGGLLAAWAGIVAVNVAHAWGQRRSGA